MVNINNGNDVRDGGGADRVRWQIGTQSERGICRKSLVPLWLHAFRMGLRIWFRKE